VAGAVLVAVLLRLFVFQAFYIPSGSMEPTLHGCEGCNNNDRIIVNKLSYRLHAIHRGDIVVFEAPDADRAVETKPGECAVLGFDNSIKDLVKRVVALSGETIDMKNGRVYIDGKELEEPYVPDGITTDWTGTQSSACKVPEGMVWVMGDARNNSQDSRVFGPIEKSRVIGRAFVRIWPITRFRLL
jgi:signal peptidase I